MCGFVGYVGKLNKNLEASASQILHRGPDKSSFITEDDFSVAFNRLSIIDLTETGMQPYKYKNIIAYLNGEIYNYLELQKKFKNEFKPKGRSDGEILPFLYEKFGMSFLNMLNGMFSIVIFDKNKKKAFFIRDRYAKKPLYYIKQNQVFYFSSEIKGLRSLVNLTENINNILINLNCLFLPQGLSLFNGVNNVKPGSYIELDYMDSIKISEKKWYLPKLKLKYNSSNEIFKSLDFLLNQSIDLRLRSDVPVGVFLSGGLDSSCILHYAKKNSKKKLTSITAIIENKFDIEKNYTDINVPERFSKELGVENHKVNFDFNYFDNNFLKVVGNCEELFLDSGNLMSYGLSQKARELGVKVILTGTGGDELFGGYPWQNQMRLFPQSLFKLSFKLNNKLNGILNSNILLKNRKIYKFFQMLLSPTLWHAETLANGVFFDLLKKSNKDYLKSISSIVNDNYKKNQKSFSGDVYNDVNFMNVYSTLGGGNYMNDMGSMCYSVENRGPLIDYELFQFMFSLSDKVKNKYGQKGIMRKFLSYKNFPDYVVNAEKSGPTMNTSIWLSKLNKDNKVELFLKKNQHILEYIFKTKIDYATVMSQNKIHRPYILFGIFSTILWFKIHVEKKLNIQEQKLSETILEI